MVDFVVIDVIFTIVTVRFCGPARNFVRGTWSTHSAVWPMRLEIKVCISVQYILCLDIPLSY